MTFQKQNYFQKRTRPKGPKANERIRAREVQVISSDGKNLGTLSTQEAINIGKYKNDQQKKAHKAKKKQKIMNLKEIKLRPVTEIHDYNFKIKNAQRFLTKGDKVKFTVQFRGREMQHTDLGYDLMKRITDDTASLGKIEVKPKFEGRQIIMIIQPL